MPGVIGLAGALGGGIGDTTVVSAAFWTLFWSLLIGLGAALLGGLAGGTLPARGRRQAAAEVRDFRSEDRAA